MTGSISDIVIVEDAYSGDGFSGFIWLEYEGKGFHVATWPGPKAIWVRQHDPAGLAESVDTVPEMLELIVSGKLGAGK